MSNVNSHKMTNEEEEALYLASQDTIAFGKLFLVEDFGRSETPPFHYEVADILDDKSIKQFAVVMPRGHGKGQSLHSRILTPIGWTTFGDINVGDIVIGFNGEEQSVVRVTDITELPMYRVQTRDGRSAECDETHLWTVQCPANTGDKLVTKSIKDIGKNYKTVRLDKRNGKKYTEYKYFLPTVSPINFKERDLPIDPYTFGAWLGDGRSNGGGFSTNDEEIFDYIPYDVKKYKEKYSYRISGIQSELRTMNVLDNKHIPEDYLFASIKQREALLQGIMDTDGNISSDGMQVQFSQCKKRERLVDDVIALVRSLGGTATKGARKTRFNRDSEEKESFVLTIRLPNEIVPVKLYRKLKKWKGSIKTKSAITSIEKLPVAKRRCIKVSNEDGLYITDDYMVTHNTVLTKANILKEFCFADHSDPLFIGWVAATQKLTVGNMDYIKHHLEFNDKIGYYFGKMKGRKWTEEDIELSNGCKLLCKSNVSGIRGGAKLHKRYERIILDDFEDENNTITQDARDKNANLVTAVVHPALEPHTGRLHINGTPVHYDSFINRLLVGLEHALAKGEEFAWHIYKRVAILENGSALWPSWFPITKLEEKKKFYRDSGMPDKFWQEYMMEVVSPEDAMFNLKHIKNWEGYYLYDPAAELGTLVMDGKVVPVNVFIGVDPATDVQRKNSDFSVLMVVAVDENNNHYVLEYISDRGLPVLGIPGEEKKGIVDYMFDLQDKYKPCLFTVEDTTMSRPIFQSILAEKRRRNRFDMKVKEETPGTRMSKRDRIQEVLVQKLSVGVVKIREEHQELRREILTFGPRMGHDDHVDALAYALKYTYVPNAEFNKESKEWQRKRYDAPRSWVVA